MHSRIHCNETKKRLTVAHAESWVQWKLIAASNGDDTQTTNIRSTWSCACIDWRCNEQGQKNFMQFRWAPNNAGIDLINVCASKRTTNTSQRTEKRNRKINGPTARENEGMKEKQTIFKLDTYNFLSITFLRLPTILKTKLKVQKRRK